MKKILGIFILAFSLSCAAGAGPIGLGLKAGIDLDNQNSAGPGMGVTQATLVGVTGGAFADIQLAGPFYVQPEAEYIQKGAQFNVSLMNLNTTDNFLYEYLEIPLLLKAQTELVPGLKGYLLAGPALAFLLTETTTVTGPGAGASANDTRFYPNTEWSLAFGGGVEFQGFLLDIRYDLGLDSASQTQFPNSQYGQNNALSFDLGYRLF